MLKILRRNGAGFECPSPSLEGLPPDWRLAEDAVWIDLISPTREEELAVEGRLGLSLPTREDMAEIEASSRLYQEGGATFLTATVLVNSDTEFPSLAPVTFVLTGERLVTIRYGEPRSFAAFIAQTENDAPPHRGGLHLALGLLDAIVDRTADILERVAAEVEEVSAAVFRTPRQGGFQSILARLGRAQMVNAKVRDSLISLARMLSFTALASPLDNDPDGADHLKSLQRDVQSLADYVAHISGNVTFLLDAALGMINTEQNSIFKVFSVFTAVFLPPTLIGAIYGMNFEHMPELRWMGGYPLALGMMVVSAVLPLLWFKRKGWL